MQTIPQYVCGVIPAYMLSRIRHTGDCTTSDDARATLEQMRELANERALTLIDPATPRRHHRYKQRNVYDAGGRLVLPGKLVLSDHKPSGGDLEAREAFEAIGVTLDFFQRRFGRNSIDGRGYAVNATVHYGSRFQNAMWNGEQMVFGDGDGHIFNRFTASVDVVAHEWVHGLIQCTTTSIGYSGEAGAVNESLADVMGSIVKQYKLGQTAQQADWLIGSELFGPTVAGRGVRSLAAPGKAYNDPLLGHDPQPSHLREYVETEEDHGGVHINSGIPNHAFYRVAMAIGGPSWEVAGRIWYHTMMDGLPNEPTFLDLAVNTVDKAGELYGYGSSYQRIVAEAWAAVGLVVPLDDDFGFKTRRIAVDDVRPPSKPRPRSLR